MTQGQGHWGRHRGWHAGSKLWDKQALSDAGAGAGVLRHAHGTELLSRERGAEAVSVSSICICKAHLLTWLFI